MACGFAVDGVDGNTGGGVDGIVDVVAGVDVPANPVLRGIEGYELDARGLGEDVDR